MIYVSFSEPRLVKLANGEESMAIGYWQDNSEHNDQEDSQ